ncbi:MAG: hypothetical protein EXR76_03065 [Myxococcales bacterium]|nr:hypothetical protein [Myxococcales bacterium]
MTARSRSLIVWFAPLFALLLAVPACAPPTQPDVGSIGDPQALSFRCVVPLDPAVNHGQQAGAPLEACGCVGRLDQGEPVALGTVACHCTVPTIARGERRPSCRNEEDDDGDGLIDRADDDCAGQADGGVGMPDGVERGLADPCENGADDDGDGLTDGDDPGCAYGVLIASPIETVGAVVATCAFEPSGSGGPDAERCIPSLHPVTQDWIPVWPNAPLNPLPEGTRTMPCEPAGEGTLRAYVGGTLRNEVAVVDVGADHEIVDIDRSVPGKTAIYVGDLISDIETDPAGRFVFTVNSSSGALSVLTDDDLAVAFTIPLDGEPVFEAIVFPPITATRAQIDAAPVRLAYVSAPGAGVIYEINLDTIATSLSGQGEAPILRRRIIVESEPRGLVTPRTMAIDDDGKYLYVGHAERMAVTRIDLQNPETQEVFDFVAARCADGYLSDIIDLRTAALCGNGLDDDLDGLVDAADPACAAGLRWEAGVPPACAQLGPCSDGPDLDGDGIDDDCAAGQPAPAEFACSNGADDDEDGRVDRQDPDCQNERDDNEAGREVSTCVDGFDNDGDGKTDADDEQCGRVELCDDGEDNDGDGASDLDDADCRADDARIATGLSEESGGTAHSPGTSLPAGTTPCTNHQDDDGDGLVDAFDPGCRFASAARRFAFETVSECGDHLDNDRDGGVDYPADPDCYAASDSSEGGQGVEVGPESLLALRYELGGGRFGRSVYAVDRVSGELATLDFGDGELAAATPTARSVDAAGVMQHLVARRSGQDVSLITVDDQGTLGTVEVNGPVFVTDHDGRPVFARLSRIEGSYAVEAFYVIEDGQAFSVPSLEVFRLEHGDTLLDTLDRTTLDETSRLGYLALPVPRLVDSRVSVGGKVSSAVPLLLDDDSLSPRGVRDPLVVVAGARRLQNEATNVLVTAASRTNRLGDEPRLSDNQTRVQFDPALHPTFCRDATTAEREERGLEMDAATPVCVGFGFDLTGHAEERDQAAIRTKTFVSPIEGITVVDENPERFPTDLWSLVYEGELPGSQSRSGQFGAREGDESWTLLDYERDYCRTGVEVGDIVLIDRLVPVADDEHLPPECGSFTEQLAAYADTQKFREPLRYRISQVDAHALYLERAERGSFRGQLPRSPLAQLPTPAPAPPAPLAACAAQLIRYRIRVADDAWLLTGARSGLRHPWTNDSGRCAVVPSRALRSGRVVLGERFENEYFRFLFGFMSALPGEVSDTLVPAGRKPHMLDVRYDFTTISGAAYSSLSNEFLLPHSLHWLPVDDRLYVTDAAAQTILEFTGFDPLKSAPSLVRSYD